MYFRHELLPLQKNARHNMHQRERISWYVLRGELIESEELNDAFEYFGGDKGVKSKAEKAEWLIRNTKPEDLDKFVDFEFIRFCSNCGKPMGWGYCINGGCEYYCSDECLNKHYTEEEFEQMYDKGKGDSYYTTWID